MQIRYKVASDSVEEKARQVEENQKTFVQSIEALKAFQDEVASLRWELHDSFQQTMQVMLEFRKQGMEYARKFCPSTVISIEALDLFKSATDMTQGDGLGAQA